MKPENFRTLLLKLGAKLGILGESTKSEGIHGVLKTYVIVEREYNDKTIAWDTNGDPTVNVYGIADSKILNAGPFAYSTWQPYTIWIEGHATMIVEDPSAPSEIARIM